ncbi:MAG: ATP-dependent DNA helicase [Clostridiales bacterium]|nr:ATP-dependent DNA helicase [Clostridiales bacterium]
MADYRVSVRTMVETVIRYGDLSLGAGDMSIMQDASKIHRKVQSQGGENYRSEVSLNINIARGDISLTVFGRIDGLIDGEIKTVQEIKTVSGSPNGMERDMRPEYWAQAECYGHMLCQKEGLEGVNIELLYVSRSDEGEKSFLEYMTASMLSGKFYSVADKFLDMLEGRRSYVAMRDASVQAMKFPYKDYRRGQRDMMRCAYMAFKKSLRMFVQAPTGTGKTAASVYPALMSLKAGDIEKIFYLTSRGTAALGVIELINRLKDNGLVMRAIRINSKDSMCPREKRECGSKFCPLCRDYFAKADAAVGEIVDLDRVIDMDDVKKAAEKYEICPYELSLDISLECDMIICDYNYAFDPRVYLRRFFMDGGNFALLIDEAHDLPDRARTMWSAKIDSEAFVLLRRDVGKNLGRSNVFYRLLTRVIRAFEAVEEDEEEPNYELIEAMAGFVDYMNSNRTSDVSAIGLELFYDAQFFIRIADDFCDRYAMRIKKSGKKTSVELQCLDAAPKLSQVYEKSGGALLFSATMTPVDYYKDVCGGDRQDGHALLPSPFDRDNLFVACLPYKVDYKSREESLVSVVSALYDMCSAKPGNYMAFFPSYAYMKKAYELFSKNYPQIDISVQESSLGASERQEFLDSFISDGKTRLAFCVLGGVFAQSVDLPGERLIGAAVVSVGLPQVSDEIDALRAYYDSKSMDGFAYSMVYPGMCRVKQASGRVIRTEQDKGVVLLIDARYKQARYASLLPAHFQPIPILNSDNLKTALEKFWDG